MLTKDHWIHFDTIESTNDYLLTHNLPHGTIVTANSQTRGKGRNQRSWYDVPKNSFLCSILLFYKDFQIKPYYSLIIALSIIEAIKKILIELKLPQKNLFIKWPNDILLIENQTIGKLSGILIESNYEVNLWKVVIGIGLNWKQSPILNQNEVLKYPPISLFDENVSLDPIYFLDPLISKLNEFSIEKPYDFLSYKDILMKYFFLNNKKVKIQSNEYIVDGINYEGFLILRDFNNKTILIHDWNEEIEII